LKRNSIGSLALAAMSVVDGYLLSGISLVGRTGISVLYSQFGFLRTWWKVGLVVFATWMILFFIQLKMKEKLRHSTFAVVECVLVMLALCGWYLSYSDFQHSLAHRLLGQRFHMGVYLFWLGVLAISASMLTKKSNLDYSSGTVNA
jgi:hypothetical protein